MPNRKKGAIDPAAARILNGAPPPATVTQTTTYFEPTPVSGTSVSVVTGDEVAAGPSPNPVSPLVVTH
ncbi:MAG: hypothetical protein ACKVKH_02830 [Verrucomicrobiales bacterium]